MTLIYEDEPLVSFCPAQGQTGPKGETGTPGPPGPPVSRCSTFWAVKFKMTKSVIIILVDSNRHLSPLVSSLHKRDLLVMSSTHSPSRLLLRADHVGTSMPARWWTMQLWMPTIKTMMMAWRKSLAHLTLLSWRLSRWSTHWAPRATLHVPARTCSSATLISLMVRVTFSPNWCFV